MENTTPQKPDPKEEPIERIPVRMYLLYALFVLAGIAVTKVAFDALTPHASASARKAAAPVAAAAPQRPAPVAAVAVSGTPATSPIDVMKKKVKQIAEPYELNGIYISGDEACALVNNQEVMEGEEVDGAKVVKITEDGVDLSRDNKIIHLVSKNR